jgi:hypothetical protein
MLLFSLSVYWQCLILRVKPFECKSVNIIWILNEISTSTYLYSALLLTDFLEQDSPSGIPATNRRLQIAWFLTFLLIVTIFVNLVFALLDVFKFMLAQFRKFKTFLSKKRNESTNESNVKYDQRQEETKGVEKSHQSYIEGYYKRSIPKKFKKYTRTKVI